MILRKRIPEKLNRFSREFIYRAYIVGSPCRPRALGGESSSHGTQFQTKLDHIQMVNLLGSDTGARRGDVTANELRFGGQRCGFCREDQVRDEFHLGRANHPGWEERGVAFDIGRAQVKGLEKTGASK